MEAAAANLTPVVLELGGKDAFIVCEDADLNQVTATVDTAPNGGAQSLWFAVPSCAARVHP